MRVYVCLFSVDLFGIARVWCGHTIILPRFLLFFALPFLRHRLPYGNGDGWKNNFRHHPEMARDGGHTRCHSKRRKYSKPSVFGNKLAIVMCACVYVKPTQAPHTSSMMTMIVLWCGGDEMMRYAGKDDAIDGMLWLMVGTMLCEVKKLRRHVKNCASPAHSCSLGFVCVFQSTNRRPQPHPTHATLFCRAR